MQTDRRAGRNILTCKRIGALVVTYWHANGSARWSQHIGMQTDRRAGRNILACKWIGALESLQAARWWGRGAGAPSCERLPELLHLARGPRQLRGGGDPLGGLRLGRPPAPLPAKLAAAPSPLALLPVAPPAPPQKLPGWMRPRRAPWSAAVRSRAPLSPSWPPFPAPPAGRRGGRRANHINS
eukprot:946199-Prorocentrum_minimum.AAC.1